MLIGKTAGVHQEQIVEVFVVATSGVWMREFRQRG